MDIDNIGFEDGDPVTVTVTMDVREAAQITRLLGRVVPTTEQLENIYSSFTAMLFNPYWDGGVDDIQTSLLLPDRIELES